MAQSSGRVAQFRRAHGAIGAIFATEEERSAEQTAKEIDTESTERAANFLFSKCQIPVGTKIEYYDNPNITATVVDNRNVEYNGETMSLTSLIYHVVIPLGISRVTLH